ncbi:type II secretion system protein N [Parvularcula sp. IMCC14364]|uniref:type II secretion system protein N n=1 Tax=Parvularcula sp. IMCC14364 TaxID=3067902 RepID=UPI002741E4D3|nr:type II secretion system protein N [Parvularcula sp. IMCC14364]
MKKRTLYGLAGLFLFVLHVISSLPLILVLKWSGLDDRGLSWSSVEGTLWYGEINDAQYQNYPIGDIKQQTGFLPLLTGRVSTRFTIDGFSLAAGGQISVTATRQIRIEDTILMLDLGQYGIRDAFDAPMSGALRVDVDTLSFRGQSCEYGQFTLWTDSLRATARRYGGQGFPLEGNGFCEDGTLFLPVAGQGPSEQVNLDIQLESNLDYLAQVTVRSTTPDLVSALRLYGFDSQGDRLVMLQRGNLLIDP